MQPLQTNYAATWPCSDVRRVSRSIFMSAHNLRSHLRRRDIIVMLFGLALSAAARADGTGWYTSEQVAQGRWEYSQKCGVCHGQQLQGAGAPALKGNVFNDQWDGKKLSDFYGYIHTNMPLGMGAS